MVDSVVGTGRAPVIPQFVNTEHPSQSLDSLTNYLFGELEKRDERIDYSNLNLDTKSQQAIAAAKEFLDSILEDDEFAHLVLTAVLGRSATEKALVAASGAGEVKKTVELDQLRKIVEQAKAEAKASQGGIFAKIFKWIAVIIAAIGAAFAVVASGGTSAPVMATLVASMVLAFWDLGAEMAAEFTDEPAKGFAWAMGEMLAGVVKAFGGSEEEVENARGLGGMILAIAIQATIGVVGLNAVLKGVTKTAEKSAKAADDAVQDIEVSTRKITDLVRRIMVTIEVSQSIAMIGNAASSIHLAVAQEKVAEAQAEALKATALLQMILEFFNQKKEQLEEEMKSLQQTIAAAGKVKEINDDAVANVIQNWNSSPMVAV